MATDVWERNFGMTMKKLLSLACLLLGLSASAQHLRVVVETSPFARQMLVLDTAQQWSQFLNFGLTTNVASFYATNLYASNLFFGFGSGNGAGITNIQGSNIVGFNLTNVPAVLNDPDALRFIQTNKVLDVAAQIDFAKFVATFKKANVWTNLVDGVVLNPRFNPTNGFSVRGNAVTYTNQAYTTWGFRMGGTNSITLPIASTTSNTIIVVFRGGIGDQYIAGLVNTNTLSGYWLYANLPPSIAEPWESSGTNLPYGGSTSPGSYDALIQPQWMGGYNNNEIGGRINQRKVWAITSDGAGTRQFYQDGVVGKIGQSSPAFTYTSPVVCPDAMTTLQVGRAPYQALTNGNTFYPSTNCEIAAVLVLNTTNFAAIGAAYTALRYLETDEKETFFFGDSRMAPDNSGTNNYPQFVQNVRYTENCWHNYAQGGTSANSFASYSLNAIALLPRDKVKQVDVYYGFGINDLYGSGTLAAPLIGLITNSVLSMKPYGVNFYFVAPWAVWTGATSPYTYSAATESNRMFVNRFFYTSVYGSNALVQGVIPTDQLASDNILNTNNAISTDGLHFYGTNGPSANHAIADLILRSKPVVFGLSSPNTNFLAYPYDYLGNVWLGQGSNLFTTYGTVNFQKTVYFGGALYFNDTNNTFQNSTYITNGVNGVISMYSEGFDIADFGPSGAALRDGGNNITVDAGNLYLKRGDWSVVDGQLFFLHSGSGIVNSTGGTFPFTGGKFSFSQNVTIASNLTTGSLTVSNSTTPGSVVFGNGTGGTNGGFNTNGWYFSSGGYASTATNFNVLATATGFTNTSGVVVIYEVTGSSSSYTNFDSRGTNWATNASWTGSKEFTVQPGGGVRASGGFTINGSHAF